MSSIETLIPDVYKLLDGHQLSAPEVVERFRKEFGDMFIKRFSQRDSTPTLRMSNLGRPLRQLWYELNGYKGEELSGSTLFKFLYGDALETLFLVLAEAAGHTVERLQEQVEIDGVKGHIDAVIDGVLVDIKSCSPYSFNKFNYGTLFENDPFGYIGQLSGYASCLKLPCRFIAIDKVSGNICMLEVPEEKVKAYDVPKRILDARAAIKSPTPPPRCYEPVPVSKTDKSGNLVLGVGCSYCAWREECWKDCNNGEGLKVYYYSTGPKFFVKVLKEPRVKEVFPTKDE